MADNLITTTYQGSLNNNQSVPVTVLTSPGWTSVYLNLIILIQDVNSNTNQLYFGADYSVIQQWNTGPTVGVLANNFSLNNGGIYSFSVQPQGNNIVVTVAQSGFATNSVYTIAATVLVGNPDSSNALAAPKP
jgi:hypothetical protein